MILTCDTFRHFKAAMEYHKTKDILLVDLDDQGKWKIVTQNQIRTL
jgi:hypothetical protein